MSPRLDHITITAVDFDSALAFYDMALRALRFARLDELVDEEEDAAAVEAAAWGPSFGPACIWLVTGAKATAGAHVRIAADSRVEVEAFFDVATRSGGSAHAAPRRWTVFRRGEFNAIVRDPGGNLIEAVCAE